MERLEAHDWPGNVRELQATLRYAFIQATGDLLTLDALPAEFRPESSRPARAPEIEAFDVIPLVRGLIRDGEADLYQKVTSAVDRVVLEEVLRHVRGNQVRASEVLGISRNTLRAKLRAARLAVEKHLTPEPHQDGQ